MSERVSPGRTETVIGAAIITAAVAARLYEARKARKQRGAVGVTVVAEATAPEAQAPQASEPMSAADKKRLRTAQEEYRYLSSYVLDFIDVPMSRNKIVRSQGLPGKWSHTRRTPWLLNENPTYGALHRVLATSDMPQGEYVYDSGMALLGDRGGWALQEAKEKHRQSASGTEWITLVSGADLVTVPDHAKTAAGAETATARLEGSFAALMGMGFYSSDMAFATWQTNRGRTHYVAVPYDGDNPLHKPMADTALWRSVDEMTEPGLMMRVHDNPLDRSELSISVLAVDLDELRETRELGVIPTIVPDPAVLAGRLQTVG